MSGPEILEHVQGSAFDHPTHRVGIFKGVDTRDECGPELESSI